VTPLPAHPTPVLQAEYFRLDGVYNDSGMLRALFLTRHSGHRLQLPLEVCV
jgi:hypothetical protein